MGPQMNVMVGLALLAAAAGAVAPASCGTRETGAAMASTAAEQKALWARIEALPEIELPDAWYEVPEATALPARWGAMAALDPKGPGAEALRAKFANGGRPFKHTVHTNMPGPAGVSMTVVAPAAGAFGRVGGAELEKLKAGTLEAGRASEIRRLVGEG